MGHKTLGLTGFIAMGDKENRESHFATRFHVGQPTTDVGI
jgi:hypothetical protein